MRSTQSDRLPSSPFIQFLRWWLGGIVCLVGIGIAVSTGFSEQGFEAMFALMGAGLSIILMNFLLRVGISGDSDRVDEDAARAEFERTGRWPGEH